MDTIKAAANKSDIKAELKKIRLLKVSPLGNHEIYIFNHNESPLLMEEVGKLREITFRHAGGGTGMAIDIDEFDTCEKPFTQLIIWNPATEEIMGGYRYIIGNDIPIKDGQIITPTGELFKSSPKFSTEYVPKMLELGRSFVIPDYQASGEIRKGIYVLENLWVGLGSLAAEFVSIYYYFGKFTMYTNYNIYARDLLLNFLYRYFPDNEKLCIPFKQIEIQHTAEELNKPFVWNDYDHDYRTLANLVKEHSETIPPLVNSYMNLSKTMKVFGTSINDHFGGVEETGILINIDEIVESKSKRYGIYNRHHNL
ncbi:MAG: GNAT family N-acetyltransferase [Bacteroidales bacterium]|nr:GNAT family N-acetyltransferase [Bacteroidales bacterium]